LFYGNGRERQQREGGREGGRGGGGEKRFFKERERERKRERERGTKYLTVLKPGLEPKILDHTILNMCTYISNRNIN
jgi:hypothetical protein